MKRLMPDMVVHPSDLISEHGIVAEKAGTAIGDAIVRLSPTEFFVTFSSSRIDSETGIGQLSFRRRWIGAKDPVQPVWRLPAIGFFGV